MAGILRIGVFSSDDPTDDATAFLDYDASIQSIENAINILETIPRPNAEAIRGAVRQVFRDVDGDPKWDGKNDYWIAWAVSDWEAFGMQRGPIEYILDTLGARDA